MPLTLAPELIEDFLRSKAECAIAESAIESYERYLKRLYKKLPPEAKEINVGTINKVKLELCVDGYSMRTLNVFTSACNSLLEYCGRRDLQDTSAQETPDDEVQPELTRTEYQHLLSAARAMENELAYLLTKIFALTGISVLEISTVTVERVTSGYFEVCSGKVLLPDSLRKELQEYARRENVRSGPIFVTRNGKPLHRSYITLLIRDLHCVARVDRSKFTPQCAQPGCSVMNAYKEIMKQQARRNQK